MIINKLNLLEQYTGWLLYCFTGSDQYPRIICYYGKLTFDEYIEDE